MDRFCLIHPCDGQTDGRTELRRLRRAESRAAFARKKKRGKKLRKIMEKVGRAKMGEGRKNKTRKAQLTQRKTRDSDAHVKAWWEQNLSSQ